MKLEYYGGQGYYDGKGECTVKYGDKEKVFPNYDEAKLFYDNLKVGKALWQKNPTELVECHYQKKDC